MYVPVTYVPVTYVPVMYAATVAEEADSGSDGGGVGHHTFSAYHGPVAELSILCVRSYCSSCSPNVRLLVTPLDR